MCKKFNYDPIARDANNRKAALTSHRVSSPNKNKEHSWISPCSSLSCSHRFSSYLHPSTFFVSRCSVQLKFPSVIGTFAVPLNVTTTRLYTVVVTVSLPMETTV